MQPRSRNLDHRTYDNASYTLGHALNVKTNTNVFRTQNDSIIQIEPHPKVNSLSHTKGSIRKYIGENLQDLNERRKFSEDEKINQGFPKSKIII